MTPKPSTSHILSEVADLDREDICFNGILRFGEDEAEEYQDGLDKFLTKPLAAATESNYRAFVGAVKGGLEMSIETHLQALRNKHADLETQIHRDSHERHRL